ncbi:MAG: PorV/PorQ family protein [Bacteroidales bacterium]|nr:PorV/PorQ family protein [Bacteroidales bacterium]
MKNFLRIFAFAALLSLGFPAVIAAQEGQAGFAMLSNIIGHNPAAQGMGGTGLLSSRSIAWDYSGNVAAVPFSDLKGDFQFSWNNWKPTSSNCYNGGLAFNINNKIGITAGVSAGAGQEFDLYDDNGDVAGKFKPKDFNFGAGISWRFIEWVSVGVNLRYSTEKLLEDFSTKAFSSDIFLMGDYRGIRLAAGVRNLGTAVKNYDGNTYPLASSATFAAGYSNVFGDHGIEAECDFDYYFSGKKYSASAPVSISLGAAYTYHDIVTVRGGYHNGGLMGNYGSVGLGLKFFGVRLDAAYLLADKSSPVANTVNVGVGYCF